MRHRIQPRHTDRGLDELTDTAQNGNNSLHLMHSMQTNKTDINTNSISSSNERTHKRLLLK